MEPGRGIRDPDLELLLTRCAPVAEELLSFGAIQLRRSAYIGEDVLPDALITSVRCLVRVGDEFVVCTNVDGASHPWPGGRREPGESFFETAYREVHEETGWWPNEESFRRLGWLRFEHLAPMPDDYDWPYPDFLQIVFVATATERDGPGDWTDTEGYEATSRLVTVDEAHAVVGGDALSRVFLDLLR